MQFLDFDDPCIVSSFVAYPLGSCSSNPSSYRAVITAGENGRKRQRMYVLWVMGSAPDSTLVAEPLSSPPSPNGLDMVSEPESEVDCGSSGDPSSELGFPGPRSYQFESASM